MKDKRLYVRISDELKLKAEGQAKKEGRTLSNYICNLISNDTKSKKQ